MSMRAGRKQAMLAALLVLGGLEQANASWLWGGWSAKSGQEQAQVPTATGEEDNGPTPTVPDILSESVIQRSVDEFQLLNPSPINSFESLTEPTTAEPKVEEAKPEVPMVEEPKIEEPKVEVPKIEEPKAEEPKIAEPKVEEPKVEVPKIENPAPVNPEVTTPTVTAPARSWSFWDYIPLVGRSTASQAPEQKTDVCESSQAPEQKTDIVPETQTVEEAVQEAALPVIDVTASPTTRVPRVKKHNRTIRRREKTQQRQVINEQASLKASVDSYQPRQLVARKATAHKVLGKSANMRSLVQLLESLARERRVMRYMISGIPPILRKPGALSDLLVLYGMTELPAGQRSLLIERGALRPTGAKMSEAEAWYNTMTEAKIEELLSESMSAYEATLQARVGAKPVVESLSTEEEQVAIPEGEKMPESKKVVDALPATKTRHIHPPKNLPHGQKNPHRVHWEKKSPTKEDNDLRRAIMKDAKNWRDLIESASSASASEEMDFNDRTVDWAHFIEHSDSAVIEDEEAFVEENAEMPDEDVIGDKFVTKPINADNAPWLHAEEDKTVYGLRRTHSQRRQQKQRHVASSHVGRQALRASLSKLQRDWRQIYSDRFEASTSSPSTDYDELEYQAIVEEWENAKPVQVASSSSDEDRPFNLTGFFAKKEKEPVELEPFDMQEFFADPKPKTRRYRGKKPKQPVSGGHGSQVRSVADDSGEDSSEQQSSKAISSPRAGRGRGRGHTRVPSATSNTAISMAPGQHAARRMQWVPKTENK